MVCLGNICRSPLAEGIMREKIKKHNLHWIVDSAGTSNWHQGEHPDKRSIANASEHGIDISTLHSRPFIKEDFKKFDLIFVMDESNYSDVLAQASCDADANKIHKILAFADMINTNVPDPYAGGQHGFELVYQMLDEACDVVLEKLINVQAALN